MPLISFIMPVKDEEIYISDAIRSVQNQAFRDWELIVVDDHSSDETVKIVRQFEEKDKRITLVHNPGSGQVQAINHGYSKISGKYLKIIDGDDLLSPSFSDNLNLLTSSQATYHDGEIINDDLKRINILRLTPKFSDINYSTCFRKMIFPPRWAWTISKKIVDMLFPLPEELPSPHEDAWIGLVIKKHTAIIYVDKALYLYRQHPGQVYGGIYNFAPEIIMYRATAMLKIIDVIEKYGEILLKDFDNPNKIIGPIKEYFSLMAKENVGIYEIIHSKLSAQEKNKLILVKKFPHLTSLISRLKSSLSIKILK